MLAPKRGTSNNTLLVVVTLPFLLLTGLAAHALNESLFFACVSSFLLASLFSVCCFFYSFDFFWPRELCGFFAGSLRENRLGSSLFILLRVLFGLNRWLDDVISFKLTTFIPLLLPLLFLAARHSGYNVEWGHLALTPLSTHNLCSRLCIPLFLCLF